MNFANVKKVKIPQGKVKHIIKDDNVLWKSNTLPNIYQAVEWLRVENNIKAYINLGFTFDESATIHLTQHIFTTGVTTYPFGAAEDSGIYRCCLSAPYSHRASLYGSKGSDFISVVCDVVTDNDMGAKNEFILTLREKELTIENLSINQKKTFVSQTKYSLTSDLYLFAQNYNGSPRFGGIRQISKFKYYDKNNNLICDLVPCYRKSDGEIGMYDLVRRIFLTNIGSGAFVKGADI